MSRAMNEEEFLALFTEIVVGVNPHLDREEVEKQIDEALEPEE